MPIWHNLHTDVSKQKDRKTTDKFFSTKTEKHCLEKTFTWDDWEKNRVLPFGDWVIPADVGSFSALFL